MAAAAGVRKSVSINDYPEHLNPFREEDNHNRIRFWTLSRKPGRPSSFSLNNIKDLRNTWSLKSFMKRSKKGQDAHNEAKCRPAVNGDSSPIEYRRAIQEGPRALAAEAAGGPERYVYGGSVTPLPRSRFQERMRSTPPSASGNHFTHMSPGRASFSHRSGEAYPLPGLARSEAGGSRLSVTTVASNPFDDAPAAPARRKKKRAPLPPSPNTTASQMSISVPNRGTPKTMEEQGPIDNTSLNVELKIVEETETKLSSSQETAETRLKIDEEKIVETPVENTVTEVKSEINPETVKEDTNVATVKVDVENNNEIETKENILNSPVETKKQDSTGSSRKDIVFEKVNIRLYRRNSSVNSESLNAENSNIDLSPNNKRCKSLSNTVNSSFGIYDIPLHIDEDNNELKDINDNKAGPQKVVCKLLQVDKPRKTSIDNSISSTEKEFLEIDRATRELEQEINRLNSFKYSDESPRKWNGNSVSEMKSRFENPSMYSPNPIPKPRRSRGGSASPTP